MFHIKKNELLVPIIVNMIYSFLYFFYLPLLSIYFSELGITKGLLGIIFGLFSLVVIFVSPVTGILSDHIGRKRVIYIGILFQFFAVILYLWPATIASIVIARIFSGIGFSMFGLIMLAKVEDHLKSRERGEKAGVFLSLGQIGVLLGSFIGPWFADQFYIRLPFIISAIGFAIMLVWMILWKSHHKMVLDKKDFNPFTALKQFWQEKKLRAMAFIGIAMNTRIPVMIIFVPLLVLQMGGGYKEVGIIFALRGLMMLFQGFAGRFVDKKGSRNIVVSSVVISSVIIIFAGFAQSYVLLLIALVFEALAGAFWNISAWTFMSEIGERKKIEGTVVGSYSALAKIGTFVFSLASGFLVIALGSISSLFFIVGILSIIAIGIAIPMLASKYELKKTKA